MALCSPREQPENLSDRQLSTIMSFPATATTMHQYTLDINGSKHALDLAPDTPLLWALRDALGLVGTKYGCGIGQCGACTVQLDGAPIRSCQMPVSTVGARKVVTIEGLDRQAAHPVQRAWQELDVPQCGYCQAGQIMSAAALLKTNPHPSDQQIDEAMAGNLCRCATYMRIRAGIHRAAELAAGESKK
jgi:isoquinoline 1-oxidoreductase alpha subunit